MSPNMKMGRLVRSFIAVKSRITEACTRVFKVSPAFTGWTLVRVLATGVLMFAGAAMYFNMTSEGAGDKGFESVYVQNPSPARKQDKAAEGAAETLTYPLEGFWIKADRSIQVDKYRAPADLRESPWQEAGYRVEAQEAAQQKLIELGFATREGEQFQASVAQADDAWHRQLLHQAGFTEPQVRNAQERQRQAYEEAVADALFWQLASTSALVELRRQGLADFQGYVNVALAEDAGFGDLLLLAGFNRTQIREAQRR